MTADEVASILARITRLEVQYGQLDAEVARLSTGATPINLGTTEAERQTLLYADLANKLPWDDAAEAQTAQKFPSALRHPDLRFVPLRRMSLRAGGDPMGPSHVYEIPVEDRILWFGDLMRVDGGNGMFATQAQADAWPNKLRTDIGIGPG